MVWEDFPLQRTSFWELYFFTLVVLYISFTSPVAKVRPALRKAGRTFQIRPQKGARPALHRRGSSKHEENMHTSWRKAGRTQQLPPRKHKRALELLGMYSVTNFIQ